MKGKTDWTELIAWGLAVLFLGAFVLKGSGTTEYTPTSDGGRFCYDTDQTFYSANGLSYTPRYTYNNELVEVYSQDCRAANPGHDICYISFVVEGFANEPVGCVCQK